MEEQDRTPLGRMKALEKILDEYEVSIGLPGFVEDVIDDDVRKYLAMSRAQMEKLTVEDCAQAALLIGGFSFHLQRSYNRELARVNWADGVLKQLVSGKETQYTGSWESQFNQAVKGDDYTSGVMKLKQYAKQRADRLTFLATSSKNMSDLFVNLQRAKVMK